MKKINKITNIFQTNKYLFVVILITILVIKSNSQENFPIFNCGTPELQQNANLFSNQTNCNQDFDNFLQNHIDDMIPTGVTRNLKIRTNVILVQDENGNGNFKLNNPDDVSFLNAIFSNLNSRLTNLVAPSCGCSTSPTYYSNIHLEYVPTFIEIKHPTLWNHRNDPNPGLKNSYNKSYLNAINTLAESSANYQPGFNLIITTDGYYYNLFQNQTNNPRKPLWDLGYNDNSSVYNGHWYSAYPTHDLNHPAMWHAPDMYLAYANGKEFIGNGWINDFILVYSGNFLHEYGHYFYLGHEGCDGGKNIMNEQGGTSRNSLNGCQVREMYNTLMTKNLRKYILCEDVLEYNLTIDNNENWTVDMKVYGNIVIESGGTLTVSCKLNMQPKTKIIVKRGGKLILNNDAIMTGCGEYWNGIIVEGDVPSGNQMNAGKVELKPGSIIENANIAISMNPVHIPWNNGSMQNYFGGLVTADGATIKNGFKAVEFMKFGVRLVKDGSTFINCKFENLQEGVTIWADNGISFDKCTFSNITNRGILPYDSDVKVFNGCSFNGVKTGIDIITTYPIPFAPQIGNLNSLANNFNCIEHGIFANASGNIPTMNVVNNNFTGGNTGVESSGISHYLIERNNFSSQVFNVVPMDGGYNSNYIQFNNMNSTTLAAHSVFNNSGLEYLGNCFSGNLGDIFVNNGDLYLYQGNPDKEAGNCFTKNNVFEIDNTDGNTIAYFVKNGTSSSSCKYPIHSYNINITNSANERSGDCGSVLFTGNGGSNLTERCTSFNENMTIAQLINEMNQIIQSINSLSNSTATSSNSYQLTTLKMCLREIQILIGKKGYVNLAGDPNGGIENMITFYSSQPEFINKITAYGMMLYNGEIGRARNYLNSLITTSTEENDFKDAQLINLDYLSDVKNYQLSANDKILLYNIGKRAYPLNGYARSLYQVLTGVRLELDKPNIGSRSSGTSSNSFSNLKDGIYSAPNPVQNSKHIIYFNSKQLNENYIIQLIDINGQQVFSDQSIDKLEYEINTNNLNDGLYILKISNHLGVTAYQTKLVVMNR